LPKYQTVWAFLRTASTGELTPVAITAVTFPLLIDAAVNDNTILGSDETIKLDGNVTISVQYL